MERKYRRLQQHFISSLFERQNEANFADVDNTLLIIAKETAIYSRY
jgi:hypothetical protein